MLLRLRAVGRRGARGGVRLVLRIRLTLLTLTGRRGRRFTLAAFTIGRTTCIVAVVIIVIVIAIVIIIALIAFIGVSARVCVSSSIIRRRITGILTIIIIIVSAAIFVVLFLLRRFFVISGTGRIRVISIRTIAI